MASAAEMTHGDLLGEPDRVSTEGDHLGWHVADTLPLPQYPGWRYIYEQTSNTLMRVRSALGRSTEPDKRDYPRYPISEHQDLVTVPLTHRTATVSLDDATAMTHTIDPTTMKPVILLRMLRHRRPPVEETTLAPISEAPVDQNPDTDVRRPAPAADTTAVSRCLSVGLVVVLILFALFLVLIAMIVQ